MTIMVTVTMTIVTIVTVMKKHDDVYDSDIKTTLITKTKKMIHWQDPRKTTCRFSLQSRTHPRPPQRF